MSIGLFFSSQVKIAHSSQGPPRRVTPSCSNQPLYLPASLFLSPQAGSYKIEIQDATSTKKEYQLQIIQLQNATKWVLVLT